MSTKTAEEKRAAKQLRAKARRKAVKVDKAIAEVWKPIEEWDNEELAHGMPRNEQGNFRGKKPTWVSRAIHEEAIRRFTDITTGEMRGLIPTAIDTVKMILEDDAVDEKGKPFVPMGVKLDAAKWVVEHLVGKPTQRVETEISVRLQGMLANIMVGEDEQGQLGPAITIEDSWEDSDEDLVGDDGE